MGLKKLMERRAELFEKLEALKKNVETEQRAFSEEEDKLFTETKSEIEQIDRTIEQLNQARALKKEIASNPTEDEETVEIRTFASIIRERADQNITKSDNGAVIPKTIANRIIDRVKDISPLFKDAAHYDIKGTVSIPYVDEESDNILVEYAAEFTELEAKSTKLLSVDLSDFLAGALAKVSMSLLNSSDIDLVDFVVGKLADAVAVFMDREIIRGTSGKITGLSTVSQIITAASANVITADELIRLKGKLKSAYQNGAYFVMAPETFTAVKLLKDGNERYLFNDDVKEGFSGTILGKPVYTTDQCPGLATGNKAIFYINPAEALGVKVVEESVQILKEKYATQHAIGIIEWLDADAKITNQQAVAAIAMA